MDNIISEWYNKLLQPRRTEREKIDRQNEYILLLSFIVFWGSIKVSRVMNIKLDSFDYGILFGIATVWLCMLIAAVYRFPKEVEEEY